MIGIEMQEELNYGVKDDTDKRLLYVDKVILENYQDNKQIKDVMALLGSKWSFYQYNDNGKKAEECDYFFWQYVPFDAKTWTSDEEHACWGSIEICVYNKSMDYDYKMRRLIDYINNNISGVNLKMIIKYGDARKLIERIESDIKWEENLKNNQN